LKSIEKSRVRAKFNVILTRYSLKMLAPIVEIFCDIDDFCKDFLKHMSHYLLPNPNRMRDRECQMSVSEMMTIIVLFQMSHYRTFKHFYQSCILGLLKPYFPKALSYTRFVSCQPKILMLLTAYLLSKAGNKTGLYYIDSTPLRVCHNKRIYRNKVFKNTAERGKTTMGWFFGFKLHLLINHQGELMSFCLTKGNVDDRSVVKQLSQNLTGLMAGDKGYIDQKLTHELADQQLTFITKLRRNMKKKIRTAFETFFLNKRGLVETIIDQLKNIYQIDHSRHRSPINFLVNLVASLIAYAWRPNKLSINFVH
jgi:hypothetical protein